MLGPITVCLGFIAFSKGDLDQAQIFFEQAHTVNPEDALTLSNLETVMEKKGAEDHASLLLVKQAMEQMGQKISFELMTDPQRKSFLKELDWSKLSLPHQQALFDFISKLSWENPQKPLSSWHGPLTLRNYMCFTEETFAPKASDQKINWQNIHKVSLVVDGAGGKDVFLKAAKALQAVPVVLKVELQDLTLTDEELDCMTTQGNLKSLIFLNCHGIEDPVLRHKAPNLVWRDWIKMDKSSRSSIRKVIVEDLLELNLAQYLIGDEGLRTLATLLKYTQWHTLSLRGNKITVKGVQALAKVLHDTKLHTLDLGCNMLGNDGLHALAPGLRGTQLHILNLSGNQIGVEGVRELVDAITSTKLHTLDLYINNIGDEGAQAVADVLKHTQLHVLNLGNNKIKDRGAQALAAGLKETILSVLILGYNSIGDEGARSFVAKLKHTKVHTLDFSQNTVGSDIIAQINKILVANKAK